MFATASLRTKKKRSACRRTHLRKKISPSQVTCWSAVDDVEVVSAIEADTHGARLMLPWNIQAGEAVVVAVANEVGLYQTQLARVCWTERLELSGSVIAGVEFEEELKIAV